MKVRLKHALGLAGILAATVVLGQGAMSPSSPGTQPSAPGTASGSHPGTSSPPSRETPASGSGIGTTGPSNYAQKHQASKKKHKAKNPPSMSGASTPSGGSTPMP